MKLILNGGGSADQTIISNQVFAEIIDNSKPILYVPLAMERARYPSCIEWVSNELKNIKCSGIEMVNSGTELATANLSKYTAMFIGGGNTFKLLKELKESGAFDKIHEFVRTGGIVYGGSAGTIIFGKDIDLCGYMDPNVVGLKETGGFNFINGISLTAHYGNKGEDLTKLATKYLTAYSMREPILALPEEDSLYINDGIIKIIGTKNYYIFNNGIRTEFEPNIEYDTESFYNKHFLR